MCTCNGKCQLKKDLQDPPMIVQHLKNTHGNKIGTMVAIANENIVLIGFSKCKKDIDKFDNQIGTEIAITRAYKWKDRKYVAIGGEFDSRNEEATDWTEIVDVPYSMDYDLYKFIRRCERYFKNINIYSTWISQLIENDWLNEKYHITGEAKGVIEEFVICFTNHKTEAFLSFLLPITCKCYFRENKDCGIHSR